MREDFFCAYVFLTAALLCLGACRQPKRNTTVNQNAPQPPAVTHTPAAADTIPYTDTLTIAAVGDIMLGTSYPDSSALPKHAFARHSFDAVKHYLQQADVAFGNLEGVLLNQGEPAAYKLKLRTKAYLFRMPESYGTILKDAGFDILSLANNHVSDFAQKGRLATVRVLDSVGIQHAGLLSKPTAVFTAGGVTYGFCAFAPNSNVVPLLDLPNAARIIKQLKQQADVVIVSFHGGAEGALMEHVPFKNESFHSEKRGDVHAFAHNAIDAGADVVLGHGPHVTRAAEVYKKRFIAYSLGNFCTYRGVSTAGVCGIAPLLKIHINKKGEFLSGQIIPTKQTHQKSLEIDTLNKVIKRMQFLTKADFKQPGLVIADNGNIIPLP